MFDGLNSVGSAPVALAFAEENWSLSASHSGSTSSLTKRVVEELSDEYMPAKRGRGRGKKPSPEAKGPLSSEQLEKKKKRMLKNRESSQASRDRQKEFLQSLLHRNSELEVENQALQKELQAQTQSHTALWKEVEQIKEKLKMLPLSLVIYDLFQDIWGEFCDLREQVDQLESSSFSRPR